MTMLLLFLQAIVFTTKTRNKVGIFRITTTLGLAVVFALGLSAFQLVPTMQLLEHTFRGGVLDYGFHIRWSLAPVQVDDLGIDSRI